MKAMTKLFGTVLAVALAGAAMSEETAMAKDPLDVLREADAGIRRVVLDNGLVVLLKEDRSADWVAVQYWVKAGSIHEADRLGAGLSHYLEHMVFKGTPSREPGRISKDIADAGGDINAYTSFDRTVFHATLPASKWRVALDTLTDAVFHANFPEEEWLREREVVLRECDMNDDKPERVISRMVWETAYQVHPYRVPVIGWRDILTKMTRDDLVSYHRAHYSPHNMILSIAGAVPLDEMEAAVREVAGREPRTAVAPSFIPEEPPQQGERRVSKTGAYQLLRMSWAFHVTRGTDADTPALDALSFITGSGRSSRLVKELVEERHLAYAVETYNYTPQYPGLFGIDVTCPPENAAEIESILRARVKEWGEGGFTDAELSRARRAMLMSSLGELVTMEGQASAMASGEFYEGDPRHIESYLRQLGELTPGDLSAAARKWLREENGTWAFLGPRGWRDARETPPPADEGLKLGLRRLSNGIRVVVREDHRLPLVSFAVVAAGGQLAEPMGKSGVSTLAAALLTRGAAGRSAAELAEALEAKGIGLSASSGRNSYYMEASGLAGDLDDILGTAADCWQRPDFPQDEFDKCRDLQLAGIRASLEKPLTHAFRLVLENLFPGHPFSRTSGGDLDEVAALGRDDVVAYHRAVARPDDLVLALFGDIDPDAAVAALDRLWGGLDLRPRPEFPRIPEPPSQPVRIEKALPFTQTIIIRAWPGNAIDSPLLLPGNFLADALSGLSSDLFIEVRDKRGLAYYAGATQFNSFTGGEFAIYAGTTEDGLPEVERQIQLQVERLGADGLRDDEFRRALAQGIADSLQATQDNGPLAFACALAELQGKGYRYPLELADHLGRLVREDTRAAARAIFDRDHEVLAIVRPAGDAPETAEPDDADDDDP